MEVDFFLSHIKVTTYTILPKMCISNVKEIIKKICSRHVKNQESVTHKKIKKNIIGTAFERAQMLDLVDFKGNIRIRFEN